MDDDFTGFAHAAAARLKNLALSLCGSHADADDLVQITLERVYRSWKRQTPTEPFAYARTVLVRAHISERRRVRWRRELVGLPAHDAPTSIAPDAQLELHRALMDIPPRQRQALVLRYLEDLPVAEVAVLMGCTEGSVKRHSFDGLRKLRTALNVEHGTRIDVVEPGATR